MVEEALESHGIPEIFNTDQGSQFTSAEFTSLLESKGIQISMDRKGRAIDNIFIERLWKSVKYEHIYLHVYDDAVQLYEGLRATLSFIIRDGLTRGWHTRRRRKIIEDRPHDPAGGLRKSVRRIKILRPICTVFYLNKLDYLSS